MLQQERYKGSFQPEIHGTGDARHNPVASKETSHKLKCISIVKEEDNNQV
jgi:hypothetical protein